MKQEQTPSSRAASDNAKEGSLDSAKTKSATGESKGHSGVDQRVEPGIVPPARERTEGTNPGVARSSSLDDEQGPDAKVDAKVNSKVNVSATRTVISNEAMGDLSTAKPLNQSDSAASASQSVNPEKSAASEEISSSAASLNPLWQRTALVSLVALFLWCIAWEIWLAPLKPGGSFMFLKALPLAFAIRGVAKGSLYTLQWSSMLILLYFMEGVVRVASDPPGPSIMMAWVEIVLSTVFFVAALAYLRPAKQAYKQQAKSAKAQAQQK